MALVESTMAPLGTPCPPFALVGVDGHRYHRDTFTEPVLLMVFMCNHCPYVRAVDDRINHLAKQFSRKLAVVAVCSNDAEAYPDDSFESMEVRSIEKGYVFPYLHDPTQETAKAFGAVCTPDFFLYGKDRTLAYRGRLDDNWQDPAAVKQEDLRLAIEALLRGEKPHGRQKPSMGCSIKWKGQD